jgi:hypothetical protein
MICGSCARVRPSNGLQSCAFGIGVLVGGSGVFVGGAWVGVKDGVFDGCGLLIASIVCPGVGVAGDDVQEARVNSNIKGSIGDQ